MTEPSPDTKLGKLLVLLRAGTPVAEAALSIGSTVNAGFTMQAKLRRDGLLPPRELKKCAPPTEKQPPERIESYPVTSMVDVLSEIPNGAVVRLQREAAARRLSTRTLLRHILVAMHESNLYDAVLEE